MHSSSRSTRLTAVLCLLFFVNTLYVTQVVLSVSAEVPEPPTDPKVETNLKGVKVPLKTDDEVVEREEQAISSEGYSIAEQKQMRERAQKFAFQAEVNRLMHLIINSLYSNKDIFLRELISNASDALDKIRFLGIQEPSQLGEGDSVNLDIRIRADPETNTITIIDKGIGMSKEELINNLGTIAKSGTKEFLETLSKTADTNLIGQFGVGFYSSFLVADRVTVTSKSNKDSTQWIWESDAENEFSVTEDPKGNTLGRGTRLTLHLKEEAKEYLQQEKLRSLVEKYSEFISFPIYLWASHEEEEEVPVEEEEEEKVDLGENNEDEVKAEDEEKKTKTVKNTVWGWDLLNQVKPLWTRSSKDITEEEYNNFFKSLTKGTEDPLTYTHFSAEGEVEFKALLYVPSSPPSSMFEASGKPASHIRLYVRRVFISDQFDEFLPRYLSFINGIVDSDDLPLNVSREILQQDRTLTVIKKKLVRKIIGLFQSLQTDDVEKYTQFYEKYHQSLKLGIIEDQSNRARLSKLLRFQSSKTGEATTFQDYVDRMKEGQKDIYYLAGDSLSSLERSPLVERALKSGYEVLYMTDPIDEYAATHLNRFDNKYTLTNIAKEGIKFDEEETTSKEDVKATEDEYKPLTDFLRKTLKSKISKAIVSDRLVKAPAALASGSYGFTANMERLMKAQAFVDQKQMEFMKSQRVLEINAKHPLITELNRRVKEDVQDDVNTVLAEVLYETAALQSGFTLDDPSTFASDIHKLLKLSLNIDVNAEAPEEVASSSSSSSSRTETADAVADDEGLRDEL